MQMYRLAACNDATHAVKQHVDLEWTVACNVAYCLMHSGFDLQHGLLAAITTTLTFISAWSSTSACLLAQNTFKICSLGGQSTGR